MGELQEPSSATETQQERLPVPASIQLEQLMQSKSSQRLP